AMAKRTHAITHGERSLFETVGKSVDGRDLADAGAPAATGAAFRERVRPLFDRGGDLARAGRITMAGAGKQQRGPALPGLAEEDRLGFEHARQRGRAKAGIARPVL